LDGFKVAARDLKMRRFSGASIRRVIDRSRVQVPEHVHDWPVLSLFVMGSYLNETEIGESFICGPSAVFYRAHAAHRNTSDTVGFEQIEIEFDPAWMGRRLLPSAPVLRWTGGATGADVRHLVHTCERESSQDRLRLALQQFLESAALRSQRQPAPWVGAITRRLKERTDLKVSELAKEVGLHPSWAGLAYRRATGESMQQTAARFRVERATCLLRETDQPYASIALEAGFCDQSHMNRSFGRLLGRSPAVIRQDGRGFRQNPSFPDRVFSCI
jgi:AraC-like DNA-binding protein